LVFFQCLKLGRVILAINPLFIDEVNRLIFGPAVFAIPGPSDKTSGLQDRIIMILEIKQEQIELISRRPIAVTSTASWLSTFTAQLEVMRSNEYNWACSIGTQIQSAAKNVKCDNFLISPTPSSPGILAEPIQFPNRDKKTAGPSCHSLRPLLSRVSRLTQCHSDFNPGNYGIFKNRRF